MMYLDDDDDDDGEGEDGMEGGSLREIFNSSVSIGEHAFSKMEADVDRRRKGGGAYRRSDDQESPERLPPAGEDRRSL